MKNGVKMNFMDFVEMDLQFGPGDVRRVADELVHHWTPGSKYLGARERDQIDRDLFKLLWVRLHARMIVEGKQGHSLPSKKIIGNYLAAALTQDAPYYSRLGKVVLGIVELAPTIVYTGDGNVVVTVPVGFYNNTDKDFVAGMVIHELRHAEDDAFGKLSSDYRTGNVVEYLHQRDEARAHTQQVNYFLERFGVETALKLIDHEMVGVKVGFQLSEFQRVCLRTFVQEMGHHIQRATTIQLPELAELKTPTETETIAFVKSLKKIFEIYNGKKIIAALSRTKS